MVKKEDRKIGKKTVRGLYGLSHFKFRQRLIEKSRQYSNCQVILVNEAYTSKTCGKCGNLHPKLESSKVYVCSEKNCQMVMDRDVNGSRNILLRNLL